MSSQLLPERRSRLTPEQWEPLSELERVTERMRRMLDQTFGSFGWPAPAEARGWSPFVDIEEADDAYVVEAELPGVKPENVNIELAGNELTITGKVKEREHKGDLRRQTRRTGRFAYRVALPARVEADNIEASLSDGVLTVRVPKAERAERKKIDVKS
jgi:HSP20 family protein